MKYREISRKTYEIKKILREERLYLENPEIFPKIKTDLEC